MNNIGTIHNVDETRLLHKYEFKDDYIDYSKHYLTIVSLADNNTITWKASNSSLTKTISVSIDNGKTWEEKTSSTSGVSLATLNNEQKMLIKGSNTVYGNISNYNYFTSTQAFNIEGNIMSLIYGDNFVGQTSLTAIYTFIHLFYNCSNLILTKNLILPATTLSNNCYYQMFMNCTSLTIAPELPATILTSECYYQMFKNCTSLTTTPELPATTLAYGSYHQMFYGCTSLIKAPELPATTLASNCYHQMFYGCTSLTKTPELPATTLANGSYGSMFRDCVSLVQAPILPATTLATDCYNYMFSGCTKLTKAPELPATTLTDNCYRYMFLDCTSLNYIKCLATDISASNCLYNWVQNVSSSGTFIKADSMTSWTTGNNGIPTGWDTYTNSEYKVVRHYETNIKPDYSKEYFTIVSLADNNTITWKTNDSGWTIIISVSIDNGSTWSSKESSTESSTSGTTLATLQTGQKMLIKGSNTAYANNSYCYSYFSSTGNFNVEGNIMSLLYGDNFVDQITLDLAGYNFRNLFYNCTYLISAKNLILPATTLANYCYGGMFRGCTSLVKAPELSATTLAYSCYENMFSGCTSLVEAPELPAITLADSCYYYMFSGCTSLTKAPELPATTLATYCYQYMFSGCTSLSVAPQLYATTLANYCCYSMFTGCTSLAKAPELPATTLANYCYAYMFSYCTSLVETPELPATTLVSSCYYYMFNSCTSLKEAPELPAITLANECYKYMFWGCTSLIKAPELPATSLATNCYAYMFNGCTSLNYIKCLATDISASNCLNYWVRNVASTGTFIKADTMNSWTTGDNGIPTDWNIYTESEYKPLRHYEIGINYKDNSNNNNTDYSKEYFTIVSLADNNTIAWKSLNSSSLPKTISVSTDGGTTWVDYTTGSVATGTTLATLNNGQKMLIKGSNTTYANSSYYSYFSSTGNFNVEGNIMSLIYGNNFAGQTTLSSTYTFKYLFNICTKLISAENLILPATILANYCYQYMFWGCTSLTKAPELPATTLRTQCYTYMFNGCTSLVEAPELPSTRLSSSCYYQMFSGCTSLTKAPELPATTLATNCYQYMFYNCTSLKEAPELPATTLASSCYYQMFYNCTSLKKAPKLPATNLANSAYYGMFSGCTSLTKAPELPATTLTSQCYQGMFNGCTSLTIAPDLPATTLNTYCYSNMFSGCSSLVKAPELPATTLATYCYREMFYGCTSLVEAPELPATTLADYCYSNMFNGCTSLTTTPELPATTLAKYCYYYMFYGCTSLNYIKCLATDISATSCTNNWVQNVASTGTFVKVDTMNSWTTGNNGIPTGWNLYTESEYEEVRHYEVNIQNNDYYTQSFTIVSLDDNNTISYNYNDYSISRAIYVSTNNGKTWSSGISSGTLAVLNTGDKLLIRGSNSYYGINSSYNYHNWFSSTGKINIQGNIMSLVYGGDFKNRYTLSDVGTFFKLFEGCQIVSAKNLILPATTLSSWCYSYLFINCIYLTEAPELPAITLAYGCYQGMFQGCTSLSKAPKLPATILADYCYANMFSGCSSLEITPNLPAITLSANCYYSMFDTCTSLNTISSLPAITLADYCYTFMFYGCTNLVNTPDILPAKIAHINCYYSMFDECSSLIKAPNLALTTLAEQCCANMFSECANLITGPELPATILVNYCYQYMFYECISLNYIKCLATDINATGCTENWVSSVSSKGMFVKNNTMRNWTVGVNGIPTGWTPAYTEYDDTITRHYQLSPDYSKQYLTIVSLSDNNTIYWKANNANIQKTISVSIDNGKSWTEYTSSTTDPGTSLRILNLGDKLLIKGTNSTYGNGSNYNYFPSTQATILEGNIMSLMYGDNFIGQTTLNNYSLRSLFYQNKVISAKNLILPAMTLTTQCYRAMFSGCNNMIFAPELPAITLANGCYQNMFKNCISLKYIKCLAVNVSASNCMNGFVTVESGKGTFSEHGEFIKNDYATWNISGISGIPNGWSIYSESEYELLKGQKEQNTYTYSTNNFENQYLTIVSLADNNTILWGNYNNGNLQKVISISIDNGNTWTEKTASSSGTTLGTLSNGQKMLIKGSNTSYGGSAFCRFGSTGNFEVQGNIMSLIYGDNFIGQTTLPSAGSNFKNLFYQCTYLVSVKNLILPATTLTNECYREMFSGCTSLVEAPELPATTLATYCYGYMFSGCTSLTTAPELPATTLANNCYKYMFERCTSLTEAPELPATTLFDSCYYSMFSGCPSLVKAPELPATTLAAYCYYYMFYGCTSLHSIKILANEDLNGNAFYSFLYNVASYGTIIRSGGLDNSGIDPSGWEVIKIIPINTHKASLNNTTTSNCTKSSNYLPDIFMVVDGKWKIVSELK